MGFSVSFIASCLPQFRQNQILPHKVLQSTKITLIITHSKKICSSLLCNKWLHIGVLYSLTETNRLRFTLLPTDLLLVIYFYDDKYNLRKNVILIVYNYKLLVEDRVRNRLIVGPYDTKVNVDVDAQIKSETFLCWKKSFWNRKRNGTARTIKKKK